MAALVGFARLFEAKPQAVYRAVVAERIPAFFWRHPPAALSIDTFGRDYADAVRPSFYPDLPAADVRGCSRGWGRAPGVYISDQITMNYVQTLFCMHEIDPKVFQSVGGDV